MLYTIFLVLGITLLIVSIIILRRLLTVVKNSERAIGKVTTLETISDDDGITYLPIFKFKTRNNEEILYRYHTASSPSSWAIGDEQLFIFDPIDPSSARLLTYSNIFNWTIILFAIAVVLIVVSGGFFLFKGYLI